MTILSTIMGVETSGGHNITQGNIGDINNRTGDLAQGYFQITGGTWAQFGGTATGFNSALNAPYSTQVQIAQNIPVARWGPATQSALQAAGYQPQPGETLGQMMSRYGEDPSATTAADGSTFTGSGTIANGTPSSGFGGNGDSVSSAGTFDPYSGDYTSSYPDPNTAFNTSGTGSTSTGSSSGSGATHSSGGSATTGSTTSPSGDVGQGTPITQGLQQGTISAIGSWISGIESAFGSGLKSALTAGENAVGTYFAGLANWFARGFLIILGIVILAIGLIALLWDHGGKETVVQMGKMAAA